MAYTDYLDDVQKIYIGYYQRPADPGGLIYWATILDSRNGDPGPMVDQFANSPEAQALYGGDITSANIAQVVDSIYLGLFNHLDPAGRDYYVNGFNAGDFTAGDIMIRILNGAQNLDLETVNNKVAAAELFTETIDPELDGRAYQATYDGVDPQDLIDARDFLAAVTWLPTTIPTQSETTTFIQTSIADPGDPILGTTPAGTTFTLTPGTAAGADVMGLTGDQDVRIDFTNPANQVKGLDLNGDGVIANDGVENNITGVAANFEIVDAYSRDKLNQTNLDENFLGDIAYDGTGFQGDGVSTNGNIFLGGLGADTALGGIGNDFMVGGGVADPVRPFDSNENGVIEVDEVAYYHDELYGGRNADFFFAELSLLDATDGDNLLIHGGHTSDDAAVGNNTPQDSDWLLLEVSDDEDGAIIDLWDEYDLALGQHVQTGADQWIFMDEIENVDASGNLYGFVDDMDVALGGNGMTVDGENVGIGSSAQLAIDGSEANNILIGGFDNDYIDGDDGNDLLMGGNLNYLNNPNMLDIVDNGMDELYGGDGDDSIVFEADGGIIDGYGGDEYYDYGDDTLYVTREALGTQTAAEVLADGVLRFELANGDEDGNSTFAGTGGADVDGTADQTNYVDDSSRVTLNGVENVIATGLGAVDYLAAGTNDPELVFNNQQNHYGYDGDLDLRGTSGYEYDQDYFSTGDNVLYANTGNDILEGREGDDLLSGGEGNDDFYFQLSGNASWQDFQYGASSGDGVDVIHRQQDADGDNIWDTDPDTGDVLYTQDFGTKGPEVTSDSMLTLTLIDNANPTTLEGFPVNGVAFTLGGEEYTVQSDDMANTTYDGFVAELNAALDANPDLVDLNAVLNADNTITITDPAGGIFVAVGYTWVDNITPPAGNLLWEMAVGAPTVEQDEDRLIFKSYEDRSDNEGVDDDAVTGSTITLGRDSYAEDTVVDFAADGTRIAEDQGYYINFENLTTEDVVTINVNGVTYQLQVGVSVDGTQIDAEDGVYDTQEGIQAAFLSRFAGFINSFMDDDTAAGSVNAQYQGDGHSLLLTQNVYSDSEETVFMIEPVVDISNLSGGERATATVENVSQSEVYLYDYAGRNNDDQRLTEENVLFIGEEGVEFSRSVLATAEVAGGALSGSEALVINGGTDDLIGVVHNLATDNDLQTDSDDDGSISDETNGNFVVHGDDYLIGGTGADTITGGTGDDRIRGSLGDDIVDGGGDLYAVRTLGVSQYAVETLNAYEAQLRDADSDVVDIYLLEQTEEADDMIQGSDFQPYFQDTLIFHQADFTAGVTEFTINLNNYIDGANQIILDEGGAGTVSVDVEGDGVFESTTTFTNFEHIRTVSGIDRAVADDGQGNDTLILTGLSNDTDGVWYDLTNDDWAGAVEVYHEDIDWWQPIIYVDGVENVIGGHGNDWIDIDETEAAKNNYFDLGDEDAAVSWGYDGIGYYNDFGDWTVEPTVTIVVESATNTDEVIMTAGRVGQTVATDTLVSVEYIGLYEDTAAGIRENDVLDVTNVATDVLVDFVNEEVSTDGELLVTIENMYELENVLTDANDTVLVADAAYMSQNSRSDSWGERKELIIDTYLNYDSLDDDLNRETVADMRANDEAYNDIPEARNFEQFTFNLGQATDRVDYSNANDQIAAVVAINADTNYVMINGINGPDGYRGSEDRVDALIGVEEIAASTGESILDFTTMDQDVQVAFQFDENNADAASDRLESLVRIADGDGNQIDGIPNFVEYYDLDDDDDIPAFNTAAWTRIEGSDFGEAVSYDGSEDLINLAGVDHRYTNDVLNLRGGDNDVSYYALETSISASVTVEEFDDTDVNTALNTGLIEAEITFQDGTGGALPGGGVHSISSYTSDNGIAAGSLKLEATQDAEDEVSFTSISDKVFILGTSPHVIDVNIGDLQTMVLTGFEFLRDAATDDVYDMTDLPNVIGDLTLVDNVIDDEDTIKVYDDAVGYGAAPADTIDLGVLNRAFGFDFDILDVTEVTENNLILIGDDGLIGYASAAEADPVASSATGSLLGDTPITVTVNPALEDDWYQVRLVEGQTYQFDYIAGTNPDPMFSLIDTDGTTVLDTDDDGGPGPGGLDAQIIWTAAETGTYFIDAYAFWVNTGDATLSVTTRDIADDGGDNESVLLGDLDLVDDIQLFDAIMFTDASITSAGDTFNIDLDAGELLDAGSNVLFTFDGSADTFDYSRVAASTDLNVTVTDDSAVGVTVIGGAGNDTITGGAGNDAITGGAGADALDGGIATEVRQIQLAGIADALVDAPLITLTMGTVGVTLTLNESLAPADVDPTDGTLDILAGSGSDAVGAALATLVNANITGINAVVDAFDTGVVGAADDIPLLSASYSSGTDLLTFTFASGANVDVGDAIVAAIPTDLGTLAASADTTISEGGDGGADSFRYVALSDGGDTITGFASGADKIVFEATNPSATAADLGDLIDDTDGGTISWFSANDGNPSAAQNVGAPTAEALFIDAANNGTVTVADLSNLATIAAVLEAQFNLVGATANSDALMVVESDTVGTFGMYFWDSNAANQTFDANEVTLIGVATGDAVATTDFALV